MDDQDKLGAMFAVMEEQQAAVQAAIAGMAQERKAKATSTASDQAAREKLEALGQQRLDTETDEDF